MAKPQNGAIELNGGVSVNVVNEPSKKTTRIFIQPTAKKENAQPHMIDVKVNKSFSAPNDEIVLLSGVIQVLGGNDIGCTFGAFKGKSIFILNRDENNLSLSEEQLVHRLRCCGACVIISDNQKQARSILKEVMTMGRQNGKVWRGQTIVRAPRQQRARKDSQESGTKPGGKKERCQKKLATPRKSPRK